MINKRFKCFIYWPRPVGKSEENGYSKMITRATSRNNYNEEHFCKVLAAKYREQRRN